jgi:predicted amidohydrolase
MVLVILHVAAALSSIAYTTYLFVRPSAAKLHVTYGLVAATLASGTYLVLSKPVHILQTCMSGLLYIGVILVGIAAARYRLTAAERVSKQ